MRTSRELQKVFRLGADFDGRIEDADPVSYELNQRIEDYEVARLVHSQVTGWYGSFDDATTDRLHAEMAGWLRNGRPNHKAVDLLVIELLKDMTTPEAVAVCKDLGLGDTPIPDGTSVNGLAKALKKLAGPRFQLCLQEMLGRWSRLGFFDPSRMARVGRGSDEGRGRDAPWAGYTPPGRT